MSEGGREKERERERQAIQGRSCGPTTTVMRAYDYIGAEEEC